MTENNERKSKVSTSIKLDSDIHKKAKIYSIQHDIKLSDLMALALLRYMRND